MPDEEFDRDLARRLRAYESRVPDADAPDLGAGAGHRSIRWPVAAGGVLAAVAAGAIITMLADTMFPEAFKNGGDRVGLATALGFATAFLLSRL